MAKNLSSSYSGREAFERGANLLKEAIENRRIFFAPGVTDSLESSLMRVRILPNGRINLDTIDELVRSTFHILVSEQFQKFYEEKK